MNERIRDLFEDAGGYYADFEDDGNFQFVLPDLEKFAQLIVRECARVAIEKQTENDILNIVSKNPAKDFAHALIEHFGIES